MFVTLEFIKMDKEVDVHESQQDYAEGSPPILKRGLRSEMLDHAASSARSSRPGPRR